MYDILELQNAFVKPECNVTEYPISFTFTYDRVYVNYAPRAESLTSIKCRLVCALKGLTTRRPIPNSIQCNMNCMECERERSRYN